MIGVFNASKMAHKVGEIYKSDDPLEEKIIRLVEYGRKCGMNNYNFEILLREIEKYEWERRDNLKNMG